MTTLENRPHTALLVIDVQNGVVEGAHERDAVVKNVGSLVEKARREQVPVVWVQHNDEQLERGSDNWRIVPELKPRDAEPLVEKNYGDSFEDTTLEKVLSGLGVGRLVVAGAQTDACIRSTLHGAFVRGSTATGPGHRAHEPVLEIPDGPGPEGRDGRDQERRLWRRCLRPVTGSRTSPEARHGRPGPDQSRGRAAESPVPLPARRRGPRGVSGTPAARSRDNG